MRSWPSRALEMAWQQRLPAKGLIFHSDRGSQYRGPRRQVFVAGVEYASRCYTKLLVGHGIKASMSRKGNCWDNACSETLFGSLKVERMHGEQFKTHREGKDEVLDWLLWYNRSRMHSTLKYLIPAQFEQQANASTRPRSITAMAQPQPGHHVPKPAAKRDAF